MMATAFGPATLLAAGAAAGVAAFGSLYASGILGSEEEYKDLYFLEKRRQLNSKAAPSDFSPSPAQSDAQDFSQAEHEIILQLRREVNTLRLEKFDTHRTAELKEEEAAALHPDISPDTPHSATAVAPCAAAAALHSLDSAGRIATLEQKLDSETTGRIRAEQRLASLVQKHETLLALAVEAGVQLPPNSGVAVPGDLAAADSTAALSTAAPHASSRRGGSLAPIQGNPACPHVMREIGTAYTPFHKRNGTPRQGSIAPHVRCVIVLHPDLQLPCVQHLQQFSHLWLLFRFHKNTISSKESRRFDAPLPAAAPGQRPLQRKRVTDFFGNQRITVPGMGGSTTGMLACRSPHHPNNIGLSLVQLDAVSVEKLPAPWYDGVRKGGVVQCVVLHVSGVDLVDATPIFDIKPYVHLSDAPALQYAPQAALPVNHRAQSAAAAGAAPSAISLTAAAPAPLSVPGGSAEVNVSLHARVPDWILRGEDTRLPVRFAPGTEHALAQRAASKASLYRGSQRDLQCALEEVLALDIRPLHAGRYLHGSEGEGDLCLLFDGLNVLFDIKGSEGALHVNVRSVSLCDQAES
jgi:tRNA (Thr-GGU) A37 N-methylase